MVNRTSRAGGRPTPVTPVMRPGEGAAIALLAPAKINLSLEVLRRRPDGYHDVASVMQAIDLVDEVVVRVEPGTGITLRGWGAPVPVGEQNLAWQAARVWLAATDATREQGSPLGNEKARGEERERVSWPLRVHVELHKRIPMGSGLGGGSTDAAAVLLGLNLLCGRPLGASDLYRLAAELGSDVPFFLAGGTCLAQGRGERLRRLPPLPPFWVVLATPEAPVATAWAYAARSEGRELTATGGSSNMLESAIRKRSPALIGRHLVNDFEQLVARRYTVVAEVLEELRGARAIGAGMTGSGSSVFALFEDPGEASRLAETLRRRNHPVLVCRPFRGGPRCVAAGGLTESESND